MAVGGTAEGRSCEDVEMEGIVGVLGRRFAIVVVVQNIETSTGRSGSVALAANTSGVVGIRVFPRV